MLESVCLKRPQGFSLIELMIALVILTFGLLAVGQLLYVAASSGSLARSKSAAAIAAQSTLESLTSLYHRNPLAADLMIGNHGPIQTQAINPIDGTILNRFNVDWIVSDVSDPRPGKKVDARLVRVMITPIRLDGVINSRPSLNKILNVTTIFSPRMLW
jgi:prepilin-type N-terminal cleavage/methylation domain-containing protein